MIGQGIRSPWRGRVGAAAVAIVFVSSLWHGVYVGGSFFNQDDYVAMAWVKEYGFGWDYLLIEFAGHVNPGQRLLYYAIVRTSPMSWVPAALVIDVMMLIGSLLMWCVLVRLVGRTRYALLGLLLFSLAPLLHVVSLWFGAAVAVWPPILAGQCAVLLFLRGHQGAPGGRLNFMLVPVVMALGLGFHEHSLLVAPLVFGTAMLAGGDDGSALGPLRTVRRFWALWLALVAVVGGFLALYLTSVDIGSGLSPSKTFDPRLVWWFLARSVAPGLVSGPWDASRNGGAVVPDTWVTVVSSTVIVLLFTLAVWRGGRIGRLAVLFLLGYAAIEVAILVVSRGGYGAVIALDPRYSAGLILPASLCLTVVLARKSGPWLHFRRRRPRAVVRWLAPSAVVIVVVGCVVSVEELGPSGQNHEDRLFITHIRDAIRSDPRTVLIDRQVPPEILIGAFGVYTALSKVLAPVPERPLFDEPSENLKVVANDGRVEDPILLAPAAVERGQRGACRHPIGPDPATWRLDHEVSGRVLVRVDYFTNIAGRLTLQAGSANELLPVRAGANRVQAMVNVGKRGTRTVALSAKQFGVTVVCVTQIAFGAPGVP